MIDAKKHDDGKCPAPPTWRQSCVFAALTLVMVTALVYCDWPFVNDSGARIETWIRAVIWVYVSGLCVLSIRLAVMAYKACRERDDLIQSRLCIFAIMFGAVAALVVYLIYSRVWTL